MTAPILTAPWEIHLAAIGLMVAGVLFIIVRPK